MCPVEPRSVRRKTNNTMNKNTILAVPFCLLAAAPVLSLVSPIAAELVMGLGTVLALLSVLALDYGLTDKRQDSRS